MKRILNRISKALLTGTIVFCSNLHAQSFDEIIAKYPNNHAVMQNYTRTITINLQNDAPVAESRTEQEILVLSDKANGIYNRQYVYSSSYNEMSDLEAYTKVPDGKKYTKVKVTDIKTETSRSNSVFYDDAKESSFDLPSLVKGAIGYVGYTQTHKDMHLLPPLYCVSYMPIVNEKFVVNFPAGMELRYSIRNDENKLISVTEDNKGNQHSYTFTAHDIKPADRFGDAPSYAYYEPHIIVQLVSYKNEKGDVVKYLGNLDDLYKWNYIFK